MNKKRYYYYHAESDSLWWSILPPQEEYDDGLVDNISREAAIELARELELEIMPNKSNYGKPKEKAWTSKN